MKEITIQMSDKAFEIFKRTAEIEERTVQEKANRLVLAYEQIKDDPKRVEENYKFVEKRMLDRKASAMYKKHPLQEYILEYYPNTKIVKKTICWRTCPVMTDKSNADVDGFQNHVGEYWYQIRTYYKQKVVMFRHIKTSKTYFVHSLKTLKRRINERMGYSHYKIKQKED